jgi:hypothetical protein
MHMPPSEKITFAFTTNALDREIANALKMARRVEKALHPDAPQAEKVKIQQIVAALESVAQASTDVECPNPFFSFFTVDKEKLREGE